MSTCHCGSGRPFAECCQPILLNERLAATAEELMRARYTAYVTDRIDFLGASLHPERRPEYDEAATRRWARQSEWLSLEMVSSEAGGPADERGSVEFVASYREKGVVHQHHEVSEFRKLDGRWFFTEGRLVPPKTQHRATPKVGRNDPCPCGSGKKYKKCCGG
jgi:SEC-C motif-containing protein